MYPVLLFKLVLGHLLTCGCLQIIYVAPMKALAAEMVQKFSRQLQCLGISVRELTGDMQLTKREIETTQVSSATQI